MTGAAESLAHGKVTLHCCDCLTVLATLPDNSVDSCVTDPPYHLTSIVKRFGIASENDDTITSQRVRDRADGYARFAATGFMRQTWDGGDIAFRPDVWREVLRVLKPGGHLLAMGGDRTQHRLACAIEDAGFEIRHTLIWLFSQGFPKSHSMRHIGRPELGTALKPSAEFCCLARKPLSEGTVAANVVRWGTGAINVDGCRIDSNGTHSSANSIGRGAGRETANHNGAAYGKGLGGIIAAPHALGRWPANVIHDGSDEVLAGFPDGCGQTGPEVRSVATPKTVNTYGDYHQSKDCPAHDRPGSAARFFFQAEQEIEEVNISWISGSEPHQATLLVDTAQLPGRAIVASASAGGHGWSTFLSGNTLTDLFRKASMCTIRTGTNSTTESRTWNYLISLLTSAFTGDVKYETVSGGSHVENVEGGVGCLIITLTQTAVFLPGVNNAASTTLLKISVNARRLEERSVSRFWYGSKADSDDRLGASHPTIKPVSLIQWLTRLITPPGGIVLDPFAGTGTVGEACIREGFRAILIEREAAYCEDVRRRMRLAMAGAGERGWEAAKAKQKDKPVDHGPLFGGKA